MNNSKFNSKQVFQNKFNSSLISTVMPKNMNMTSDS